MNILSALEKCEIVRVGESTSDKEKHDSRALKDQKGGVLSQLMAEHRVFPHPWYSFCHQQSSQNQNALSISEIS